MTYDEKKFKKCVKLVEDARVMLKIMGLSKGEIEFRLPNLYTLFRIPEDITNPCR